MARKIIDVSKLLRGMVAENTLSAYAIAWNQYYKFAGSLRTAMKGETLTGWRQHMVTESNCSAATINIRLSAIKTIARELYAHGKIKQEQHWAIKEVTKLPGAALKERRRPNNRVRIEPEQMRTICTSPPVSAENDIALRDRALMMTLATTGTRISEALAIKVHDIRPLPGGNYVVTGIFGKRDSDPRSVPLSPEAYEAIQDWLAFRPINSPYVFTGNTYCLETGGVLFSDKPMSRHTALNRVKIYGEQNGMPEIKCHDFRRFVGTQLAKDNIRTAQKVLGHANIATTVQHYVLDDFIPGSTNLLF